MASKVLVPSASFGNIPPVKKSQSAESSPGFVISNDAPSRVAHLENSIRYLQEQHLIMLTGLHLEIEALREKNRDLQYQLIVSKEESSSESGKILENEERMKSEISRLEEEATAARGETRAAEARAVQLQKIVDAQSEKIAELQIKSCTRCTEASIDGESRSELRARLAEAERLVRRLRADADRHRRELQCMKNSLQASLRVSGLDPGYGFHNSYHFPPLAGSDFWTEPLREEYNMMVTRGRNHRRPLTLPELSANAQVHRATIYVNNHTRPRPGGFEYKPKKTSMNNENLHFHNAEESTAGQSSDNSTRRPRRHQHHRKQSNDHS